jgi:hypothetical protein
VKTHANDSRLGDEVLALEHGLNLEDRLAGSISCARCIEESRSHKEVLDRLNGEWRACEGCANEMILRTISKQYRSGSRHWWHINHVRVLPVWIEERVRGSRSLA